MIFFYLNLLLRRVEGEKKWPNNEKEEGEKELMSLKKKIYIFKC